MIRVPQTTIMYLIPMKMKVTQLLLMLAMLFSVQAEARFPEFGFCPLGGPPGWFNRVSGQNHRYHRPPAYPLQMTPIPYSAAYLYPQPWRTDSRFNPSLPRYDQR